MNVNVFNEQTDLKISLKQIYPIVSQVLKEENVQCDEVNIYFVDTPTICELHDEYFDDPSPTDCISFPMDEEAVDEGHHRILGEVFVCPATAIAYAAENNGNAYTETTLYIVHGILHLLGYDDLDDQSCLEMRGAEKRLMDKLSSHDLVIREV